MHSSKIVTALWYYKAQRPFRLCPHNKHPSLMNHKLSHFKHEKFKVTQNFTEKTQALINQNKWWTHWNSPIKQPTKMKIRLLKSKSHLKNPHRFKTKPLRGWYQKQLYKNVCCLSDEFQSVSEWLAGGFCANSSTGRWPSNASPTPNTTSTTLSNRKPPPTLSGFQSTIQQWLQVSCCMLFQAVSYFTNNRMLIYHFNASTKLEIFEYIHSNYKFRVYFRKKCEFWVHFREKCRFEVNFRNTSVYFEFLSMNSK